MDVKTLRLASLQLSEPRLAAFVTYQRALLEGLRAPGDTSWTGRYAFAHGKALTASGLDLVDLGKLKALVGDFAGRRSSLRHVRERIERGPADSPLIQKARAEVARLEDLSEMKERYGAEAVELLLRNEVELVDLHRDLARQEGGGHLHPTESPSGTS